MRLAGMIPGQEAAMGVVIGAIWFDGWGGLERVLIATPILYAAVVVLVRLTGKRSTSQMNNFDWVVTVAIGSIIASPILLRDVTLAEALVAIALLFGLQWLVTKAVFHSELAGKVVRATPTVLVYRGSLDHAAMKRERVSEDEIISAIRENGMVDLSQVGMVVLESDAKLSVIAAEALGGHAGEGTIGGLKVGAEQEG